jgi:hypothetical protein
MTHSRLASAFVVIALLDILAGVADAQCIAGTMNITAGAPVLGVPVTATTIFVQPLGAARVQVGALAPAGAWTPDAAQVTTLATQPPGSMLEFVNNAGAALCQNVFTAVVASPPGGGGGPGSGGGSGTANVTAARFTSTDCVKAGAQWEDELFKRPGQRRGAFTELVFMEGDAGGDANVCYYNRDYGVVGDPIYVGMFSANAVNWQAVRFEPCAAQSTSPNIQQSSEKFPSTRQSGAVYQLYTFLGRRCFNTVLDVSAVGNAAGQTVVQRYPMTQYDRYRATLQAGVLYTGLHQSEFALRSDQADTSKHFIFDQGPTNRGPEYIASLQLYSVLKYFPSLLRGSAYPGRDPIHDQDLFDRLGAVVGVAITNPTQRFSVGASFEVIYGVSVTWVADYARINEVVPEVSMTTPFKGTVADIPVVKRWRQRPTIGISIDLRYLSVLFSGNR